MDDKYRNYTIEDIARDLGIDKSTVSRALSGKGRISKETRSLVTDFIAEHGCRLNSMARGLAQGKTFNIGLALYEDCDMGEVPFFQKCASGICSTAGENDYDVLLFRLSTENPGSLNRIISSNKIDGVILTRTIVDDPAISILTDRGIPFVVVGSSDDSNVTHIDEDHVAACRELTSRIMQHGIRHFALMGGKMSLFVNRSRLAGFSMAVDGHDEIKYDIFRELDSIDAVSAALDAALELGAECVICMDDYVCRMLLILLHRRHLSIPQDISVASFYSSSIISSGIPEICSIDFSAEELGKTAAGTLLEKLSGRAVEDRLLQSWRIIPGASVK